MSLSELTQIIFNVELTHLGSEALMYQLSMLKKITRANIILEILGKCGGL